MAVTQSFDTQSFDVLILGGGAAGLMCAIEAGKRGRRVAVLEHADRLGKKILISGGGRCNFTNIHCQPENFISANPHFAKSALSRYTPADFIALVEKHRIPYHEKTLGQLFCDRSAREILQMLEQECMSAGVTIFLNTKIAEVTKTQDFVVRTAKAEFRAPALVVATGGLSIPKIGATSFGYDLARQFGLKIREPWPGLVPLVLSGEDRKQLLRLEWRFDRGDGFVRRAGVPREDADHSSRAERTSDSADFVVLEDCARDSNRLGAGGRSDRHLQRSEGAANDDDAASGVSQNTAGPFCRSLD